MQPGGSWGWVTHQPTGEHRQKICSQDVASWALQLVVKLCLPKAALATLSLLQRERSNKTGKGLRPAMVLSAKHTSKGHFAVPVSIPYACWWNSAA